jgi:hypothetical protein
LWGQARAATRKSVATCHIIIAITHFLATLCFLWQYPITMRPFAMLMSWQ